MIKRTIEISERAVHVSVKNRQLVLMPRSQNDDPRDRNGRIRRGTRDASLPLAVIPCEDVGLLLVDQPAVTYSHAALVALLDNDAAVVLCGRDHLPAGLLLPIGEHSQVVWRIRTQLAARKPTLKRLWQKIVQAKIRAQAAVLPLRTDARSKLLALARIVRTGDPHNVEAQAARAYWAAWRDSLSTPESFASAFRRNPDGPPPNNLLNYGYAVMRAAVARAIVAAGLLPAIGIKHIGRSNAFCLADDLVEPLRPMVDDAVRTIVQSGESEISPDAKRVLLGLLASDVCTGEQTGPLLVGMHRYVASFVRCLQGEQKILDIPIPLREDDVEAAEPLPVT